MVSQEKGVEQGSLKGGTAEQGRDIKVEQVEQVEQVGKRDLFQGTGATSYGKTIGPNKKEQVEQVEQGHAPTMHYADTHTHIITTTRRKKSEISITREAVPAVPLEENSLEGVIERRLKKEVEKRGCLCFKFESPGNRGVPDRIVITKKGKTIYCETKRPKGGRFSKLQEWQIGRMREHGAKVYKIHTIKELEDFIKEELEDGIQAA